MTLPDVDRICVVIGRTRHGMVQAEIQAAAKQGARLLEIRLDYLKKAPDFKRLLDNKPCPMIATVRRPPDGGKWDSSEEARLMTIRQAIVAGFDWIDLETDVIDKVPRFGKVRRIVSYHNFREMPQDLEKIHQRMCAQDADVVKIVARAQSPSDNLRVLALVQKATKPTIAFCSNDMGFPSRILQAKYGAPWTYAAFNKERNIAPGIPSLLEMQRIYHYHEIDAKTEVYGVIGDPVAHSLSPLIHNAAFRKAGINAVYLPFRVPRDTLADFLGTFHALPVRGFSVTIPHKEAAAELADKKDTTVQRTQAANTLVRTTDGYSAFNTDYGGFLQTLRDFLPKFALAPREPEVNPTLPPSVITANINLPPGALTTTRPGGASTDITQAATAATTTTPVDAQIQGRIALVLGAGGVARAVAHALHREGALVTIANRTSDRAQQLAGEIGCRHVEWNARHSTLCDLVVNCTSIGMHPNVDDSPLHHSYLKPGLIVFDTVYTPETTLLVKEARDRGCHIITGVEMFIRQAALQFEHFTGRPAPVALFQQVIRKALSPVAIRDEG
ncbi:MAG: type I 3-dehydroquinate dehydratase [Gemmataceae bacterium]